MGFFPENCVLSLGSRHSVEPRNLSPKTREKVCFVDPTPHLVDLPGNDPQKPPAAASPEPRLNILGAL